jgi:hypothetical protein
MGNIDFYVISASKNSNTFQKTRFWKEKSVEDVVTLGRMAQATLVFLKSGPAFQRHVPSRGFYFGYAMLQGHSLL